MTINFTDKLSATKPFEAIKEVLASGANLLVEELWNGPKACLAAIAAHITGKNILLLTGASREEQRLLLDFPFFTDLPVVDFPAWETLPHEGVAPSPDIVGERYHALYQLRREASRHIIICGLQAALQRVIAPEAFDALYLTLKVGDVIAPEMLAQQLQAMGYQRCPTAADKGEYAVRGGIVDLFPVSASAPHRLEFWGDDIESIRLYDPLSQTSVHEVSAVEVPPALELELLQKAPKLATILDYIGDDTIVVVDDLLSVEDRAAALASLGSNSSGFFGTLSAFLDQVAPLQKIYFSPTPLEELTEVRVLSRQKPMSSIRCEMLGRVLEAERWRHPFATVSEYLLPEVSEGTVVSGEELIAAVGSLSTTVELYVLADNDRERESFLKRCNTKASVSILAGYLSSGFAIDDLSYLLFPLTEVSRRYKIRRQKLRATYHAAPLQSLDLKPGDLVVHLNNGIGKFLGIESRPNNQGIQSEFLHLSYAEGATLYVPIQQAHLVTKYIGATDQLPSLHTLGSGRWKKARDHTQKAIVGYAKDLLNLYAERQLRGGMAFPVDSEEMVAFEGEFPFTETEDQLHAIASIKKDMETPRPMDRLVCGDVGYGKTEVAMRAAFKAAADGGVQVAVLVPTTVLAMQHYENFKERMRNFPLNIGVLSRFNSAKQTRETLDGIATGSVDILIGTHRIISKDVQFKNLGLIIIDEEQRFGVRAKEHLKKVRADIDCLTLTATPIPRTLYMSLVGARDMSLINTPPEDRLPISTVIAETSDEVIRTALLRELARDGQAYVIHNRVETTYELADRIQQLVPHARVAVVHGQMEAHELDNIFHAFRHGEIDVLVATTIIENGIDVPNANTILIDRADHYGLATLYQMRGRVGRWNRRAYAYLLVKERRILREEAQQRLHALVHASGYGGGIKVAMRDLEIRGAGDLLGTEQSGHVATIGFHFYCKLLKRTVEALQGRHNYAYTEVKMEFPIDAKLPESYVNEVSLRMEIYQRLGEAFTLAAIDELWREVQDRFGAPPPAALWLYHMSRVRLEAATLGYTMVRWEKMTLVTERRHGDNMTVRRSPLKPRDDPAVWEKELLQILQNNK